MSKKISSLPSQHQVLDSSSNHHGYVWIVLLNWNGLEDTLECVNSLLKIKYLLYRIHIIDNGSTGDDFNILKKRFAKTKKVLVTKSKRNEGFAGGSNIGIKESLNFNAPYTLLLNNDTIVDKYFLGTLMSAIEMSNKNIGAVGPAIYYYNKPNVKWEVGKKVNYFSPLLSSKVICSETVEVDSIVGCCMLINNKAIKKVGLFDEDYFAYGEEDDLNFRLKKQGYKIYYCPESRIWHKVSSSTGGEFSPTAAYYKMRNKIKFVRKNLPLYYWPSYFTYLFLYFIKRSGIAVANKRWDVVRAMISGVKDGI